MNTPAANPRRFRLKRPHDLSGGHCEIWVGYDGDLKRDVALKRLNRVTRDNPEYQDRLRREALTIARLNHPGILPVFGTEESEEHGFMYAMPVITKESNGEKLPDAIRGESLEESYRRQSHDRSLPRPLLEKFVRVCRTIQYAHDKQFVHRDLKPQNILLGSHEEVWVIDWGIVKHLAGTDGPAETAASLAPGTDIYMSPEQASDEPVTPATDIYSLGACLYSIIVGQPAFKDETDVLKKVKRGLFVKPRRANRRVPHALEAICLKAMEQDPRNRYGSPEELASDVRDWLDYRPVGAWREPLWHAGVRRIQKHPKSAAGLVILLIAAIIAAGFVIRFVEGQLAETETQRGLADRRRIRADARFDLALGALERYRSAVEDEVDVRRRPELRALRDILLSAPLEVLQRLRGELLADEARDPQNARRLARTSFDIGRIRLSLDPNPREDTGYFEEVIRNCDELERIGMATAEDRSLLARALVNRAALRQMESRTDAAEADYLRASRLLRSVAASQPYAAQHPPSLAGIEHNLGNMLWERGDLERALSHHREACRLRDEIATRNPGVAKCADDLAVSLTHLGSLHHAMGQPGAAGESYARALQILERLVERAPTDAEYRADLADLEVNIGNLLKEQGREAEAIARYEHAVHSYELLETEGRLSDRQRPNLARAHHAAGYGLRETPRWADARFHLERAASLWDEILQEPGRSAVPEYRADMARTHQVLGKLLARSGEPQEALDHLGSALETRQELARKYSRIPDYRRDLVDTLAAIGDLRCKLGMSRPDPMLLSSGITALEHACEVSERLAEDHPNRQMYWADYASTLENLAAIKGDTGLKVEAINLHDRARVVLDRLIARDPENVEAKTLLGLTWYNLACEWATYAAESPPSEREERAERAVEALSRAVSLGMRDCRMYESDPDLEVLHSRNDFQMLLQDLAFPAYPFQR